VASDTPTEYDPEVMRRYADLLYSEAQSAVITTLVGGGVIGVLIGGAGFSLLADHSEVLAVVAALGVPFGTAILGGMIGESRALRLRAHAQQLRALVTIEMNVRKGVAAQTQGAH